MLLAGEHASRHFSKKFGVKRSTLTFPTSPCTWRSNLENQRLEELGERTRFITSRDGEERGWVRLREASEFVRGSAASEIEARVHQQNEAVGEEIRAWLQRMDWRTFESTFLTRVLEALGFQDVQITQATRDGGADARVAYQRGVVGARAIVSAKRWTARTVPVDEVRMMRGVKGEEDTAIIVTTGRFSADAQNEAKPGQNQRVVYLIDGEKLIDICKRNQIGVKKVTTPRTAGFGPGGRPGGARSRRLGSGGGWGRT